MAEPKWVTKEAQPAIAPAAVEPFRGSNPGYIGRQIEKAGKRASDYDWYRDPMGGSVAVPKGTPFKGNAVAAPTAQRLNWGPFSRSTYFTDAPSPAAKMEDARTEARKLAAEAVTPPGREAAALRALEQGKKKGKKRGQKKAAFDEAYSEDTVSTEVRP